MRGAPSEAAWEAASRPHGRLALAMPPLSAIGLALVVWAAATGQSTPVVALAALVGFGVCALAPLALPRGEQPGAVDEVLSVVREIRAGQESAELLRAALTNWERTALAAGEAIRALRAQCEELAETKAQSESHWVDASQRQWAEISDALTSLVAASSGGERERIEQMLVYLAETLERRDEEGRARIDQMLADMGRETQSLRDEIAARAAEGEAAERRRAERLEAMEARLSSHVDAARVQPGLDAMIAREATAWGELASRLDRIESHVSRDRSEVETKSVATLARVADKLRNAIDRLDTLSACAADAATTQNDELKAALKALEVGMTELASRGQGPQSPHSP